MQGIEAITVITNVATSRCENIYNTVNTWRAGDKVDGTTRKITMSSDDRMSRGNKIITSIAVCFGSLVIALVASGTVSDKVLWFIELSVFCMFVVWTIL